MRPFYTNVTFITLLLMHAESPGSAQSLARTIRAFTHSWDEPSCFLSNFFKMLAIIHLKR